MTPQKISFGQTACILIISRVIVSLTYSPSFFTGGYSSADLLAAAISLPVILLQYIPVFLLNRKGGSVITLSYDRSKVFGYVVSVLYTLFLLWISAITVARFDVFISTSVFSQYIFYGFMLPSVLAFFAALKGIEGIARAATVIAALLVGTMFLLFFAAIGRFDFLNLISPSYYGEKHIFNCCISIISRSSEAAILCVMIQFVKDRLTSAYLIYAGVSVLLVFLALLTVVLVIGDFSFLTMFPYDSAAGNISAWSFLDLEPLLIAAWIVGVFIKCSLCVTLCCVCLEKIIKNRVIAALVSSVLVMAVSFILSRNTGGYTVLFTPYINLILIGVFTLVLPVLVLIFGGKKCSKKY